MPSTIRPFSSWFLSIFSVIALTAQVPAPSIQVPAPYLIPAPEAPAQAKPSAEHLFSLRAAPVAQFDLDTSNREEVRIFYNAVFFASEGIEMHWNGDYLTSNPGGISSDYLEATRLRVNFYRAMSGVPSWITFDSTYNAKDQQAAFTMSGEGNLSHQLPSNWLYYTSDGEEAAANSNLALGYAGPDSITGYIRDHGVGNEKVGHRKWILHPPHQIFGSGDVPGDGNLFLASSTKPNGHYPSAANALWIFDGNTFENYPNTRDGFVAWPPKGFVPYSLVFARWSFAVENGDFSQATVTMNRGNTSIPVSIQYQSNDTKDHIVWVPEGKDTNATLNVYSKPENDTTYTVHIQNVIIDGSPQNFTYETTLFDPEIPTPSTTPTLVSGPNHLATGAESSYLLRGVDDFDGLQWRKVQTALFDTSFNAESGLGDLTATTGNYTPYSTILAGSGSYSYRLGVLDANSSDPQILTLNPTFVPSTGSVLTFKSRIGFVTSIQIAYVEVSTDGGNRWESVWQKSNPIDGELENSYQNESIDLSSYAGTSINIRFIFRSGNSFYLIHLEDPNFIYGWALDDIAVSNTQKIIDIAESPIIDGRSFQITSNTEEAFFLQVRPRVFDQFFLDWSDLIPIQVSDQGGQDNGFATLPNNDGWQNTIYGWIKTSKWPWVYHLEHGWLFAKGNATALFGYDLQLASWTYTDANYYPWIYYYNLDVWLRHQAITTTPNRWFWAPPGSINGQLPSGWIEEQNL